MKALQDRAEIGSGTGVVACESAGLERAKLSFEELVGVFRLGLRGGFGVLDVGFRVLG